jgi:molybdenum cofactor cytidylyltransferase
MSQSVTDHPERARYEIDVDGELGGFTVYHRAGHRLTLIHTETGPRFRGQGLGGHLVTAVLDDARRQGLAVLPSCPFARAFIAGHPEYTDLVPADRRAEFGL